MSSRTAAVLRAAFVLVMLCAVATTSHAQAAKDSSAVGPLRPRYGSYLIPPYPNPSAPGEDITVQWYNHHAETASVTVYDLQNRPVDVLQAKGQLEAGLHSAVIPRGYLASGTYFVRLLTFTPNGAEDVVDNTRFVIVK